MGLAILIIAAIGFVFLGAAKTLSINSTPGYDKKHTRAAIVLCCHVLSRTLITLAIILFFVVQIGILLSV